MATHGKGRYTDTCILRYTYKAYVWLGEAVSHNANTIYRRRLTLSHITIWQRHLRPLAN